MAIPFKRVEFIQDGEVIAATNARIGPVTRSADRTADSYQVSETRTMEYLVPGASLRNGTGTAAVRVRDIVRFKEMGQEVEYHMNSIRQRGNSFYWEADLERLR